MIKICQLLIKIGGTLCHPLASVLQFIVVVNPTIDSLLMIGELLLDHFHHRIPDGSGATFVQEVSHIHGSSFEEQLTETSIVHQMTE